MNVLSFRLLAYSEIGLKPNNWGAGRVKKTRGGSLNYFDMPLALTK